MIGLNFRRLLSVFLFLGTGVGIAQTYCEPGGSDGVVSHITSFETTGAQKNISNLNSGLSPLGYGDFTATDTLSVVQGQEIDFTASASGTSGFRIWIDWNSDGVFDFDEEVVWHSNAYSFHHSGKLNIPETAIVGHTRMRIVNYQKNNTAYVQPCETDFLTGEFEDYTVEIQAFGLCTGVPSVGTLVQDIPEEWCGSSPIYFTMNGSTYAEGLTYEWLGRPLGSSDAWNLLGNDPTLNIPGGEILESYEVILVVTCNNSTLSDTSEVIELNNVLSYDCYCHRGFPTEALPITSVIFGDINNQTSNVVNYLTPELEDFTELSTEVIIGESHPIEVKGRTDGSFGHYVTVYIDWNQDGVFDSSEGSIEKYEIGEIKSSTGLDNKFAAGDIEVPINAKEGPTTMRVIFMKYLVAEPCGSVGSGQAEDYTIIVSPPNVCEGTPDGGTVDDLAVCKETSFSLTAEDVSPYKNGITYRWQYSEDEVTWIDILDANDPILTVSDGITTQTYYRHITTCLEDNNASDTSNIATVSLKVYQDCYCVPTSWSSCDEMGPITEYLLNYFAIITAEDTLINNYSGCSPGSYGDYTYLDAPILNPGESYAFYLGSFSDLPKVMNVKIWIDYNNNGLFDEDELAVEAEDINITSSSAGFFKLDFTVPFTAVPGEHRVRVRFDSQNIDQLHACAGGFAGETEDYLIVTLPAEDCEGTPTAGIVTDMSVCKSTEFVIETLGASDPITGIEGQWQSSVDGETWMDIPGAVNTNYIVEGIEEVTYYRYILTCALESDASDTSDVMEVSLEPLINCFCEPVYTDACNNSGSITEVVLEGASYTLSNSSDCSTGGYESYTSLLVPDLIIGENYDLEVSINSTNPTFEHLKAWIDFNDNGVFEEGELIVSSGSTGMGASTVNFNFTVPSTATTGVKLLRVRIVSGSLNYGFEACDTQVKGEAEDYWVEILEATTCAGTPDAGSGSDLSICASEEFSLLIEGASPAANGLSGQWQSSIDGVTWTDVSGETQKHLTVENGIEEDTYYRYILTCIHDNASDTSDIITVSVKPVLECYCIPTSSVQSRYLSVVDFYSEESSFNFQMNEDNLSEYIDSTSQVLKVYASESVEIYTLYDIYMHSTSVWVDWNNDGVFDSSEEVFSGDATGIFFYTLSSEFEIPADAEVGTYRIRVRGAYKTGSQEIPPCGDFINSTTIDFTLEVWEPPYCVYPPDAGDVENFDVCASIPFTIEATNSDYGLEDISGKWESSTDMETWEPINGSSANTHFIENGIEEITYYRYIEFCLNNGISDTTDVLVVSLKPEDECHCTPIGMDDNAHDIVNFTLGDLDNSSVEGASITSPGYSDYTGAVPAVQLYQNESYVASLTSGSGLGNHGAVIWIDYNDNGEFEPWERVAFISDEIEENSTVNFPAFVVEEYLGTHVLRVAYVLNESGNSLDACEIDTEYSEVEDYLVEIILVPCSGDETPANWAVVTDKEFACYLDEVNLDFSELVDFDNVTYQFQSSLDGETWTDIGSSVTDLTEDIYFRGIWFCNEQAVDTTDALLFPVYNPEIVTVVDGGNCGAGEVDLQVTAPVGYDVVWYDNSDGLGTPAYIGENFTTPHITETTSYWALVSHDASNEAACKTELVEVVATISNLNAGEGDVDIVCANEIINLDGYLTNSPDENGTWYDYNNNILFSTTVKVSAFAGVYNYNYIMPSDGVCPSDTATVEITINTTSYAGEGASIAACMDEVIDLGDVLTNNPDPDGTWYDSNNNAMSNSEITITDFGNYTYRYEVVSEAGCTSLGVAYVNIEVENLRAGVDTEVFVCQGETFNLLNGLDGNPQSGGIWKDENDEVLSGGSLIELNDLGEYLFTYIVSNANCMAEANLSVEVVPYPNSGIAIDSGVCAFSEVYLPGLLIDADEDGVWTKTNGSPLPGGIVNFGGITGTYYFNYTVENDYCSSTTEVKVIVGPTAEVGTGGEIVVCKNESIDLFESLGGYPEAGGTWFDVEGNALQDIVISGDTIARSYTYSITNGVCTSEAVITIPATVSGGEDVEIEVCRGDSYILENLLEGNNVSGVWSNGNGNIVDGNLPINVGFDSTYYHIVSDITCKDTATVSIVLGAYAGEDVTSKACKMGMVNLDDLLYGNVSEDGTWYDGNNQVLTDPYISTGNSNGLKLFTYVVSSDNCVDVATVKIHVVDINAGEDNEVDLCPDSSVNLWDHLAGNPDLEGAWFNEYWDYIEDGLMTTSSNYGSYEYIYLVQFVDGCNDSSKLTINVIDCTDLSVDEEFFADLIVYPNPTTDILNISNSSNTSSLKLELLDMNGRLVYKDYEILNNTSKASIDIQYLERGVYTLRLYSEEGQKLFKIVKQ